MGKIPFLSLVLVLTCTVSLSAALNYQAIPGSGVTSGSVDVYDTVRGAEYGYARINWWYWQDNDSDWHYSYQIINDGDPVSDPSIHFGFSYSDYLDQNGFVNTGVYDSINKFSLYFNGASPSDLVMASTAGAANATGTLKGDSWYSGPCIDPLFIGVDWTLTSPGGTRTPLAIDPSRWDWNYRKGARTDLAADVAGNNSTTDLNAQYFHLVSSWAPGEVIAAIASTGSGTASGTVFGPSVMPEPASLVILALGSLAVVAGRNRKHS